MLLLFIVEASIASTNPDDPQEQSEMGERLDYAREYCFLQDKVQTGDAFLCHVLFDGSEPLPYPAGEIQF